MQWKSWAWRLGRGYNQEPGNKYFSGNESSTTNNRMELTAAIKGIDKSSKDTGKPLEMTIFTDSNYLRQGITEWIISWKKNNWVNSSKNLLLIKIYG